MQKTGEFPQHVEGGHDSRIPNPEEIRRQLKSILGSPAFQGSKRCRQFLEHVCERSLAGEAHTLKERTIAIEVFGRHPHSDLGDDTIVRGAAREVRKKLALYHVTAEGMESPILIGLPPGSYAPEFRYGNSQREDPPEAEIRATPPQKQTPAPRLRRNLTILLLAGLAMAAAMALAVRTGGLWRIIDPNAEAFRQFWNPVTTASEPLLLAVGHPIVYFPSARARNLTAARQAPAIIPMQQLVPLSAGDKLTGSDLVPVMNQYVGFGDMVVATEVARMLARGSKDVRVRLASGVEFADLRQSQVLLIGAYTNRWTMTLGQSWRFRFARTPERDAIILDTEAPLNSRADSKQWSIPAKEDGTAHDDYLLICRIRNSPAGGFQIVGAGLMQFGTEAAGRLLTDQEQLGRILSQLPAGWETKNLQIVLHASIIGNTPAQPEVVAVHVW